MRLTFLGMSSSGKSHWSRKLVEHGFIRFCCDDLIAKKLATDLKKPDGTTMKLGEWMGFPYEPHYKNHESTYLTCETEVLREIIEYLKSAKSHVEENIVVDTTGSVIYTGEEILAELRQYTTVVLMSTPPEVQKQMLKLYIHKQRPVLWRDMFNKKPDETNEEALARCYPGLLTSRECLYEKYADVVIDYYKRNDNDFGATDLLHDITTCLSILIFSSNPSVRLSNPMKMPRTNI